MTENPEFEKWQEKNSWYLEDQDLTRFANGVLVSDDDIKGLPYREQLRTVERRVKEAFPQKFKNLERERQAAVDGGELRSGRMLRPEKPSYRTLPSDARAECDKLIKRGIITKEKFVRSYYEED